ncbi:EVE domain-containing protein [Acetobacter sp. TBRC 12305]|uniref:EVE domain-containing protein n=1 Tax=Acetobacter garciniae TaxID=2817435 RepID=A0A939HGA7_9PROT|nr:EVE domain-containing protein [Acetobacter garciniae]MBO1323863.1 EVE domain-containing protein [Acetobacter garciniae]MBX0343552.1 EVE domain-containing protein [Acetobacter garciniae]
MAYWLVKSEPDAFSWAEQVAHDVEPWTGVRNHQAKKNLMAMKAGDRAFFYHSNVQRAIVGVVEVVREAYPDPTVADGSGPKGAWVCVDVKTVGSMPRPVALSEIKDTPALAEMALVRQSRLSVCPVTQAEWALLCEMGAWAEPG